MDPVHIRYGDTHLRGNDKRLRTVHSTQTVGDGVDPDRLLGMLSHDGSDQLTITVPVKGNVGIVDIDDDPRSGRPLGVVMGLVGYAAGPVPIDGLWLERNDAVKGIHVEPF